MINPFSHKYNKTMKREVKIGTKIEMEHTKNPAKARVIAMQHVTEFPNYYSKGLIPMERKLRRRR